MFLDDAELLFERIRADGKLPFTDKADPEMIRSETGLSKAAFKRAVGKLYKERKITLANGRIREV